MAKEKKFLSLKTELGLKFGLTLIILLAMGFSALFVFKTKLTNMETIDRQSTLAANSMELRSEFDEMVLALKTMIIQVNNPKVFQKQLTVYKKKFKRVQKLRKIISKKLKTVPGMSSETIKYYQDFKKEINEFIPALQKAIPLLEKGDAKGAISILKGKGLNVSSNLQRFSKTLEFMASQARKHMFANISKLISYGLTGLIVVTIFALIAILTFLKRICNMVNHLNFLTEAANAISTGKKYKSLTVEGKRNEIAKLTESFERMRVSLEKAMEKLQNK